MGTTPDQLDVICELHRKGFLPYPAAIADLGVQQFHAGSQKEFDPFIAQFGGKAKAPDIGAFTGYLFKECGFSYTSFDIVDAPFCHRFDLNTDAVPQSMVGAFDLVLNFGTSEHVMNQFNAFKVMHDFAKPGGLIYGLLLQNGYDGHGLVRYTSRFVDLLAKANGYEIVRQTYHDNPPTWRTLTNKNTYFRDICKWVVFKKTSPAPFRAIVDV